MIKVESDRRNLRSYFSINNAIPRIRKGIREALTEIGRENVKHTRKLIKSPPKSGRWYFTNGRWHRASAPGQPPANRTGTLQRGVSFRVYGWERMEFGDTVFYGRFLELGTKKMHPRPHLSRTVRMKERDNFKALEEVINRVINKT